MLLLNRVKCEASLVAGSIVTGAAVTGYLGLPSLDRPVAYLLENSAGQWEIGTCAPDLTRVIEQVPPGFGDGFGSSATGLTLTVIASLSSYVDAGTSQTAPSTYGAGALAVGAGAQANAVQALAVGSEARAISERATALGYGAQADQKNSAALGVNARVAHAGETAIGGHLSSHISILPVMTGALADGVAQSLQVIDELDSYAAPVSLIDLPNGVAGPYNSVYGNYAVRVFGTVGVTNGAQDDAKFFDVNYLVYAGQVRSSSITAVFTGSNAPAITLVLNASRQLEVTVATGASSYQVNGVLRVDKVHMRSM